MNKTGEMMLIEAECYKCDKPLLVALVGDDSGNLKYGPEDFSETEQKVAVDNGALLKMVDSKTAGETYLANACKSCDAFIGQFFFFAHYYTPALYGHYPYKRK